MLSPDQVTVHAPTLQAHLPVAMARQDPADTLWELGGTTRSRWDWICSVPLRAQVPSELWCSAAIVRHARSSRNWAVATAHLGWQQDTADGASCDPPKTAYDLVGVV